MERFRAAIGAVGLFALAACGNSHFAGAHPASAGFSPRDERKLTTRPRSVDYQTGPSAIVSIFGGWPPYTFAQSNPSVATISASPAGNALWSFLITSVAGGKTVVRVTDSEGNSATVPAAHAICLPPIPDVIQVYPKSGATHVPTDLEGIIFKTPGSGRSSFFLNFFARLVGSDGSVVTGGHFTHILPPSRAGALSYSFWRASLPALGNGVEYHVQYADAKLTCLPPAFSGTFTTK